MGYVFWSGLPSSAERARWRETVAEITTEVQDQDALKSTLRDPSSAEFSDTRVSRRGGIAVTCGHVNARNGLGGMTGRQRFVSGPGINEVEENGASFDAAWRTYC